MRATIFALLLCSSLQAQPFRVDLILDLWGDDVNKTARLRREQLEKDFTSLLLDRLSAIPEIVVLDSGATYVFRVFLYEVPEECNCDYIYHSSTFEPISQLPYTSMYATEYYQGFGTYSRLADIATEIVGLLDRTHIDELRPLKKYLPKPTNRKRRSLLDEQ